MRYSRVSHALDAKSNSSSQYLRLPSRQGHAISGRSLDRVLLLYATYGSCIFILFAGSLVFWFVSFHKPILFPYDAGQWILANEKYTTIFCTIVGALLGTWTIHLLNCMLVLMSKQVMVSQGTSLSTIEVWERMFNKNFIFDGKRVPLSALTLAFWVVVLYVGTAYTSLITPTNVLVTEVVQGTEIDFDSPEFWKWYNYRDDQGNFNRTDTGCHWSTYENSRGATTFPTCPYNNDPIGFLNAGFSAAQTGLSLANPSINYLDKHYEGSTGGTLPVGWAGFLAFSDIQFDTPDQSRSYSNYNYSLSQQGLTAEVSCKATPDSPIVSTHKGTIDNTILGIEDGLLNIINYTWTCPDGQVASSGQSTGNSGSAQVVVPKQSWATLVVCQSPTVVKEYTVYIGAYGSYATDFGPNGVNFPNMTCTLKPMLTNTVVQYSSTDALFRVNSSVPIPNSGSKVPNETYQAVDRAFSLATSYVENMVVDSIHGFVSTNKSISIPNAMEYTLRGYIEFFATNLRMYYSSNEPPGRHPVVGNYTVWRVGYKGQPIVLVSLLPPFLVICGLAIAYVTTGTRTGSAEEPSFNPLDSLAMLLASAAGGHAGKFPFGGFSATEQRDMNTLRMRVKYAEADGQVVVVQDGTSIEAVELLQRPPKDPDENRASIVLSEVHSRTTGHYEENDEVTSRTKSPRLHPSPVTW